MKGWSGVSLECSRGMNFGGHSEEGRGGGVDLECRPRRNYGMESLEWKTDKIALRDYIWGREVMVIDVGQWLVSGLQWPSSVRQSLAVQQKELSEEHRMTLKIQKCIENKQNLCNFPFFSHFILSFFYFSFFFLHFFSFFCFFSLLFSLQVYDRDGLYDKIGLQLKTLTARPLRRC